MSTSQNTTQLNRANGAKTQQKSNIEHCLAQAGLVCVDNWQLNGKYLAKSVHVDYSVALLKWTTAKLGLFSANRAFRIKILLPAVR